MPSRDEDDWKESRLMQMQDGKERVNAYGLHFDEGNAKIQCDPEGAVGYRTLREAVPILLIRPDVCHQDRPWCVAVDDEL